MYRSILLLLLVLAGSQAFAQTPGILKIYAFRQAQIPGARHIAPEEEGNSPRRVNYQYYLYVETSGRKQFRIENITLDGLPFKSLKPVPVKSPVTMIIHTGNLHPDTVELVPAGTRQVCQLPLERLPENLGEKKDVPGLVMVYFYRGKRYRVTVKELKVLPSVAHP